MQLVIPELTLPEYSEVSLEVHYQNFLMANGSSQIQLKTSSTA